MSNITAIAPWYGSARMIAGWVAAAVGKQQWIGIPFCGGCSEVRTLQARSISCNDQHRHLINLASVINNPDWLGHLIARLERQVFHPDVLASAQKMCRRMERASERQLLLPGDEITWAASYFICSWMTRSGSAGTPSEFTGGLSIRWESGGGDSAVRFHNAVVGLEDWREIFRRKNLTFTCLDAFEFLDNCQDKSGHAIYCDPPFLDDGLKYTHGPTRDEQRAWHQRLAQRLREYRSARVVVRAHAIPELDEWYPAGEWERLTMTGRTQTNAAVQEVLLRRG